MLTAASSRSAGDDTADRAQLHPRIVDGATGAVYSPPVLHLRDHGRRSESPGARRQRAQVG
jgi:hypothetical protein